MAEPKEILAKKYHSLTKAVHADKSKVFRELFDELHPHDQSKFLASRGPSIRKKIYDILSASEIAECFVYSDQKLQAVYLEEMTPIYAADMLSEMFADDAVNILNELDSEQVVSYLALMKNEDSRDLRTLLHYPEDTAGSLMTTEYVATNHNMTVIDTIRKIKDQASEAITIYYVYVLDNDQRLVNVVSLRELMVSDDKTLVGDLSQKRVISVNASVDQEKVAKIIKNYNLIALPVVDIFERLLGIITVDDVVDVIEEEAADDYSKFAAVEDAELTENPIRSATKRLPWLMLLLFLGMGTATLIGSFEETIAKVAILGAFIPVIAGTTGNSGTQALAVVVRGLATGSIDKISLRRHFMIEATTALITSVTCGVVLAGIIFAWKGELMIGLVAGTALIFSILVGTMAGSSVPVLMHKLNIDPAVASGPLITTICDIISMSIYFGIATTFMAYLIH